MPKAAAARPRKPRRGKVRTFLVTIEVEVTMTQKMLDSVLTEEWRAQMYPDINTPMAFAEHLAFNMVQGRDLTDLDGFADQKEGAATCTEPDVVDATEIETPKKKSARRRLIRNISL